MAGRGRLEGGWDDQDVQRVFPIVPSEMAQIGFDEAALLKELGITYVHIPMRGSAENPYGPKQLDQFAETLASAQGKVLLHCTVAWRASHLWGAYLIRDRNGPVEAALAQTRKINLRDEAPFGGVQPFGHRKQLAPGLPADGLFQQLLHGLHSEQSRIPRTLHQLIGQIQCHLHEIHPFAINLIRVTYLPGWEY